MDKKLVARTVFGVAALALVAGCSLEKKSATQTPEGAPAPAVQPIPPPPMGAMPPPPEAMPPPPPPPPEAMPPPPPPSGEAPPPAGDTSGY